MNASPETLSAYVDIMHCASTQMEITLVPVGEDSNAKIKRKNRILAVKVCTPCIVVVN